MLVFVYKRASVWSVPVQTKTPRYQSALHTNPMTRPALRTQANTLLCASPSGIAFTVLLWQ